MKKWMRVCVIWRYQCGSWLLVGDGSGEWWCSDTESQMIATCCVANWRHRGDGFMSPQSSADSLHHRWRLLIQGLHTYVVQNKTQTNYHCFQWNTKLERWKPIPNLYFYYHMECQQSKFNIHPNMNGSSLDEPHEWSYQLTRRLGAHTQFLFVSIAITINVSLDMGCVYFTIDADDVHCSVGVKELSVLHTLQI